MSRRQLRLTCPNCGEMFTIDKRHAHYTVGGSIFCSESCAEDYANSHPREGGVVLVHSKLYDLGVKIVSYILLGLIVAIIAWARRDRW